MSFNNNAASAGFAHNRYKLSMGPVEEANFKGEMYYARSKFTGIAPASSKNIVINVGSRDLFIVGRSFSTTTDRMELDVFVSPTYSGGTTIPISPYNNITPVLPAQTTGLSDPTVTDDGVLFDEFLFLGAPNNNPNQVAGSFRANEVLRMVPANTTFLIRARNEGTINMDGIIKYLFFERDVGEPLS